MHAETLLSQQELAQRWRELVADPNTPEFVELSEFGELILSPTPTNRHERVAFRVARALEQQLGAEASTAVSVQTKTRGVRRPDAVWMPPEKWDTAGDADPLPLVPDICVEVLSPSNTRAQVAMKTAAYLDGGANEVITVGLQGEVRFFGPEGERHVSVYGLRFDTIDELFK